MNPTRPDVVFDCNVFLQAHSRTNGPAAAALRSVEQNIVTLYVSRPILRELRATLAYPEIRQKNPQLTDDKINAFISRLSFRGVLIRDISHAVDFPRDPDDEPYIDLAAAVEADYLVTRDQDLLSLATDHSVQSKHFDSNFPDYIWSTRSHL